MKEKLLNIGPVISEIMDKASINSYENLKITFSLESAY